ncbi:cryptochrome/photolyase family protein [Enterobacter mori]|uniref:cryptochrome/photolyase family protein n=1 Tax=Enterobacter mori TaxID=539813 RepID=UPI003D6EB379
MTELRLILGDQLNPHHGWFYDCNPNVIYVMLELRAETAYVLHHAQKVIAIFAAMRRCLPLKGLSDRFSAGGSTCVGFTGRRCRAIGS